MSNPNIGAASPRSSTEPEKAQGVRRSTHNIPIHKHAVGVSATVDLDDQILLHAVSDTVGKEVVRKSGLDLLTFVESGLLRVKANHAVTVAPVTQVGMEMYLQDRQDRQDDLRSPLGLFASVKPSSKYKKVGLTLANKLENSQRLSKPIIIDDIDWYGENENVLVAKFDIDSPGFESLQQLREKVIEIFGEFGLKQLGIYPVDHVTLARFGTKRHPIEFNDDIKKYAQEITRPKLIGTELHLGGIALTRATGEAIPIRKKSYDPSELTAYQAWRQQQTAQLGTI